MPRRPHRCALIVTLVTIFATCVIGATVAGEPGDQAAAHLVAEIDDVEPDGLLVPPVDATISDASTAPHTHAPGPLLSISAAPPPSPPPRR